MHCRASRSVSISARHSQEGIREKIPEVCLAHYCVLSFIRTLQCWSPPKCHKRRRRKRTRKTGPARRLSSRGACCQTCPPAPQDRRNRLLESCLVTSTYIFCPTAHITLSTLRPHTKLMKSQNDMESNQGNQLIHISGVTCLSSTKHNPSPPQSQPRRMTQYGMWGKEHWKMEPLAPARRRTFHCFPTPCSGVNFHSVPLIRGRLNSVRVGSYTLGPRMGEGPGF